MAKQANQTFREVRMKSLFGLFINIAVTLFPIGHEALAARGDLEEGKTLYMKHCAVCHGPQGKGDGYLRFDPPVADLTSPAIQKKSDFDLWRKIHEGVSNTAMGDWRWTLSDAEAAHLLTYVRSFSH